MNNFETALVKEVCPVCCKEQDGALVMNTTLTPTEAKKVKDLHGKVVDISKKSCKTCTESLGESGGIFLIGIITEKSGKSINEIYRSGVTIGITNDGFTKLLENITDENLKSNLKSFSEEHGFIFMDHVVLTNIFLNNNPQ